VDTTNSATTPALTSTVTPTLLPAATATPLPPAKPASDPLPVSYGILLVALLGCLGIVIRFWAKRISASED